MNRELRGYSFQQRLRAAHQLSKPELEPMIGNILSRYPVEHWPYGNSTSINPLMVTLGPLQGGSPNGGDWDQVCFLVTRLLMTKRALDEDDAYPLFGNMNLDFHQSGDASGV